MSVELVREMEAFAIESARRLQPEHTHGWVDEAILCDPIVRTWVAAIDTTLSRPEGRAAWSRARWEQRLVSALLLGVDNVRGLESRNGALRLATVRLEPFGGCELCYLRVPAWD